MPTFRTVQTTRYFKCCEQQLGEQNYYTILYMSIKGLRRNDCRLKGFISFRTKDSKFT